MSNWIKGGISVVNITNLEKVLTVSKAVYKSIKITDNDGHEKRINRLEGIQCKVIDEQGRPVYSLHHSKELIPLAIASKGRLEAYKFINREGEYKDY